MFKRFPFSIWIPAIPMLAEVAAAAASLESAHEEIRDFHVVTCDGPRGARTWSDVTCISFSSGSVAFRDSSRVWRVATLFVSPRPVPRLARRRAQSQSERVTSANLQETTRRHHRHHYSCARFIFPRRRAPSQYVVVSHRNPLESVGANSQSTEKDFPIKTLQPRKCETFL